MPEFSRERDMTLLVTIQAESDEQADALLAPFWEAANNQIDTFAHAVEENEEVPAQLHQQHDMHWQTLELEPRPPLVAGTEEDELVRIPRKLYERLKLFTQDVAFDPGKGGYSDTLGYFDGLTEIARTLCEEQGWPIPSDEQLFTCGHCGKRQPEAKVSDCLGCDYRNQRPMTYCSDGCFAAHLNASPECRLIYARVENASEVIR